MLLYVYCFLLFFLFRIVRIRRLRSLYLIRDEFLVLIPGAVHGGGLSSPLFCNSRSTGNTDINPYSPVTTVDSHVSNEYPDCVVRHRWLL